jgi:hypothetical protein
MNIIKILVEGQTEIIFVKEVVKPYLYEKGVSIKPFLFQEGGGIPKYSRSQKQIMNTIKSDPSCICATMVDFYGLPKDWPGRRDADSCRGYLNKAAMVENALFTDICIQLGSSFDSSRFIPYVQMYEFEALLFSDTTVWADEKISGQLEEIKQSFSCPEEINDNYQTCPSRRIKQYIESYVKTVDGITAAKKIGLVKMRAACPHFNGWITQLESLGNQ